MPYDNGERISQDEYIRRKRIREGRDPEGEFFATGPNGENPGKGPELDEETQAPKSGKKAGTKRSQRSKATVSAAVADALGVAVDSPVLADIDASGIDEESSDSE